MRITMSWAFIFAILRIFNIVNTPYDWAIFIILCLIDSFPKVIVINTRKGGGFEDGYR